MCHLLYIQLSGGWGELVTVCTCESHPSITVTLLVPVCIIYDILLKEKSPEYFFSRCEILTARILKYLL